MKSYPKFLFLVDRFVGEMDGLGIEYRRSSLIRADLGLIRADCRHWYVQQRADTNNFSSYSFCSKSMAISSYLLTTSTLVPESGHK